MTSPLPVAAALAAALVLPVSAGAAFIPPSPFPEEAALAAEELESARGGWMVNGVTMDFAIITRTLVDGQGLQTVLKVNDRGGLDSPVTTAVNLSEGTILSSTPDGGFTLTLPSGAKIVHDATDSHLHAQLANTSNGANLSQTTQFSVDLPGFAAQTQAWYSGSRALQASMEAAMSGLR